MMRTKGKVHSLHPLIILTELSGEEFILDEEVSIQIQRSKRNIIKAAENDIARWSIYRKDELSRGYTINEPAYNGMIKRAIEIKEKASK